MHLSQEYPQPPLEPDQRHDASPRALVVVDRPLLVGLIEMTLNHGPFVVRATENLAEAESILAGWPPDLAVINTDDEVGIALLERLRASRRVQPTLTPVLGLTQRGDLQTRLRAFEWGVDDILTVPFSPEELLARAIVITRRSTGVERPIVPTIRFGEMEVDIVRREVRAGSAVVRLSVIEQSLLYLLASRGGRTVTRAEILDAIWGMEFEAGSNIVDHHIRKLRSKLQDDYRNPRFIATVPGQGYRFVPIRHVSGP